MKHLLSYLGELPDHNCEVRAMSITEMAGGAFLWSHDARAFFICIHGQHLGWAELDTDMTTFTPGCIDKNLAARTFLGRQHHSLWLAWYWI
jgi:hypothetical protein